MIKSLLYILLFCSVTAVMALLGIFISSIIVEHSLYSLLGINKVEVVVYVVAVMGFIWALLLFYIFTRNGYSSFSLGTLYGRRFWLCIVLSIFIFLSLNILAFWCHHLAMPFSNEHLLKIEIYRAHPLMTLVTLLLLYSVTQLVFMGGVLRELSMSISRRWVAQLIVALLLSLLNLFEGGAGGVIIFLFAVCEGLIESWLWFATRSIWPSVIGAVFSEYIIWMFLGNIPTSMLALAAVILLPVSLYGMKMLLGRSQTIQSPVAGRHLLQS